MSMAQSRQVRRATERRERKEARSTYPLAAQRGGPSRMLIHRNRRHREDGADYFKPR